jgi:hypothetical protein
MWFIVDHSAESYQWIEIALVVSKKLRILPRNCWFCEYRDIFAQNGGDIRNQLAKLHRIIYNSQCLSKKKSVSLPDKILKSSLSVFCKRATQFTSDWSQTFTNYSSMSDSSLTIARLRTDELSRGYESPKNRGFCLQILIFANRPSFWCKSKVIFGISSSSCIESYIYNSF